MKLGSNVIKLFYELLNPSNPPLDKILGCFSKVTVQILFSNSRQGNTRKTMYMVLLELTLSEICSVGPVMLISHKIILHFRSLKEEITGNRKIDHQNQTGGDCGKNFPSNPSEELRNLNFGM